jgi:hypothetical protein
LPEENEQSNAIALGAGVIAGIVLGTVGFAALAIFGGKKGYERFKKLDDTLPTVTDNPLYESAQTEHFNPFYTSDK